MDAQTLEALKGSIEKWRAIEEGRDADFGSDNCPLCALFLREGSVCIECPVFEKTGKPGCEDTPYMKFQRWGMFNGRLRKRLDPATDHEGVRLARAEREFLESLLPGGETSDV